MGTICSGKRIISADEISARAARAAAGFKSLGIGLADTVLIYLRNDFAFFEASLAASLVGAYPVPANWHSTANEARYLFEDSGAKTIVIHSDLFFAVRAALPAGVPVLVVPTPLEVREAYGISDASCAILQGMTVWDDWLEAFSPVISGSVQQPGTMIYTSGTTGRPKGVRRMLPTQSQAEALTRIRSRSFGLSDVQGHMTTVVTGPMYHSAPNSYGTLSVRRGADVILQPRFDAEELLRLIEMHRVTHLHMVPIMFNRLLKLPEKVRSRYDLSSLRFVVHAAAPVSPQIKRAMIDWWGPVINEYYGSTETNILTFCNAEEWLRHPSTVGRPIAETDLRILDATGEVAPSGSIGTIAARTMAIADFTYHGDDEARRKSDQKGLFVTGDVGFLDDDGFLYLCDRANDMVISGGVNIYPAEIEGELHKVPGVSDCAVFGIPDEEFGEVLLAVVELQVGAALTSTDVQSFLRGKIAGYKIPKFVSFQSDLPREDSGKIFKRKLREPYWAHAARKI